MPEPQPVRIECFRCGRPHAVYPPAEFQCDCGVKFSVFDRTDERQGLGPEDD